MFNVEVSDASVKSVDSVSVTGAKGAVSVTLTAAPTTSINLAPGASTGNANNAAGVAVTGGTTAHNILPAADVTYSLGSATQQWKDLYVGPGTIYVNGSPVATSASTFTGGNVPAQANFTSVTSSITSNTGAVVIGVAITSSAKTAIQKYAPDAEFVENAKDLPQVFRRILNKKLARDLLNDDYLALFDAVCLDPIAHLVFVF